jgi:hypothetical protein
MATSRGEPTSRKVPRTGEVRYSVSLAQHYKRQISNVYLSLVVDWFTGLSEQFLSLKAAKILVLAGSDRLDTALMRGQMMGKFELRLLYGSGHAIQEDCPDQMAKAIAEFCSRCARTVDCERFGLEGPGVGDATSTSASLLAERLAKARSMVPPAGAMPAPAVMPKRPST